MKTKVKHGYGGCEAKSGAPTSRPRRPAGRLALVPRRKTPRPPEEALAISRALRERFISPEAEATAKRLLAEQATTPAPTEKPFTASERERAAEILAHIRKKYPQPH